MVLYSTLRRLILTADLSVQIGSLHLKNPVLVASGTFGYGKEFEDLLDLNRLGGIITKTITLEPRPGNPPPRIVETTAGMLNSIGLANVGVNSFIKDKLPYLQDINTAIIVNVAGRSFEEFQEVMETLENCSLRIDAYELNYSCPNVKEGGMAFSADPQVALNLTKILRAKTDRPLFAKLTPNVTKISDIARAVKDGGADAVSAINTLVGLAVDHITKKPKLSTITGGLSGPAIKPVALAKIWEIISNVDIPVIGLGGIMSYIDALEFFTIGTTAIQIGTANFIEPAISVEIIDDLSNYCVKHNISHISDLIGTFSSIT